MLASKVLSTSTTLISQARIEKSISILEGLLHLAVRFLEHFKIKKAATIINVSSLFSFVPVPIINPVYDGTKAWLHFWVLNLRTQLSEDEKSRNIEVVEIAPPPVETDLHRDRSNPDDNKRENNPDPLSLDEFMEFVRKRFEEDSNAIGSGPSVLLVDKWFETFGDTYEKAARG